MTKFDGTLFNNAIQCVKLNRNSPDKECKQQESCVQMLLEGGADLFHVRAKNGMSPLMHLVVYPEDLDFSDFVLKLVENEEVH